MGVGSNTRPHDGKETMAIEQRGRNAVRTSTIPPDPRWGGLDPEENMGKVKLMEHSAYGQRYFRNVDVKNRESRGWKVIDYSDPTIPVSPPQVGGMQVGQHPSERPDIVEAAPAAAPKAGRRKPTRGK